MSAVWKVMRTMPRNIESMPGDAVPWEGGAPRERSLTTELVDEIADKVYAMLLLDLRIDDERMRPLVNRSARLGGGWC